MVEIFNKIHRSVYLLIEEFMVGVIYKRIPRIYSEICKSFHFVVLFSIKRKIKKINTDMSCLYRYRTWTHEWCKECTVFKYCG